MRRRVSSLVLGGWAAANAPMPHKMEESKMQIAGKVALITGGASGLGEATVRRLLESGGQAVILDIAQEKGEQLAAELGDGVIFTKTDITDETEVKAALEMAMRRFGRIDILANVAGIDGPAKLIGQTGPQSLASFSRVINVNLIGTFNIIRLAAEKMILNAPNNEGERGVIINTSSIAAFEGQIGQASYSASKAAVAGMTLPLARELARYGIRVVTIAPGIFATPLLFALDDKILDTLEKSVPFPGRPGKGEEFALMVESIINNPMLNGTTIRLDGALRM